MLRFRTLNSQETTIRTVLPLSLMGAAWQVGGNERGRQEWQPLSALSVQSFGRGERI